MHSASFNLHDNFLFRILVNNNIYIYVILEKYCIHDIFLITCEKIFIILLREKIKYIIIITDVTVV